MSLPALLLSSMIVSASTRVLVVVPDVVPDAVPDAASVIDAGVREGLQARAGFDVLGSDAASTLLADARDAGLSCNAADVACWLRVATLGGLDAVVLAHGEQVLVATSTTTTRSPTTGVDATAWAAATRRALGLEGAVRLFALPQGARVVVDGVQVDGMALAVPGRIVAVAPGDHTLVVDAVGFAPLRDQVRVEPGAIVDVALALVTTSPPPPRDAVPTASLHGVAPGDAPSSSTLWWSGVGALGVSAVGAGVLLAVGQVPYLRCYDADAPAACATDGAITSTANATAVAALVVGGVGLAAGAGALVASAALP